MNVHAEKPVLEVPFPKPQYFWTDPITGMIVPKDPIKNLQWRAELLTAAENDQNLQVDLYTASAQSILFWANAFAFTLRVKEESDGVVKQASNKHLPYVTWDIQDQHILKIENGMDAGESLLTDKSRDMGATWDHLLVLTHRFCFRDDESHLILSRKEDAVDGLAGLPKDYPHGNLADPGTLFGKIDYILNRLPEWMLPKMARKKLHVINLDSRTRIDGESANATAGSSDRRTSIFLDEFAKVDEAESIKRSTRDVTACRLVCSTPNGAGTTFSKWRLSGQIPVFVLPWWEHPEKGAGRYVKQDELGRWQIRSPWYDHECTVRSPKELSIELDMDHVGSGDTFFESNVIEQHKKLFSRPPYRNATILIRKNIPEDQIARVLQRWETDKVIWKPVGPWRLWTHLINERPDQNKTYTVACDISKGQGASNSVISVLCNETREKVAEYADANCPPHALAKIAVGVCLFFGGRSKKPLLIWENNGDPGFDFGNQITRIYQYPNVYYDRVIGTVSQKVGKRYGWRSSPEKKAVALGMLRRAYSHGRLINHSEEALNECLTYVHYENGGIGPAGLVQESTSARSAHGDRVIADMLMLVGAGDFFKKLESREAIPQQSFGRRFRDWKQARQAANRPQRSFNFQAA